MAGAMALAARQAGDPRRQRLAVGQCRRGSDTGVSPQRMAARFPTRTDLQRAAGSAGTGTRPAGLPDRRLRRSVARATPVIELDHAARLVGRPERMSRQLDTADLCPEHDDAAGMALLAGDGELEAIDPREPPAAAGIRQQRQLAKATLPSSSSTSSLSQCRRTACRARSRMPWECQSQAPAAATT